MQAGAFRREKGSEAARETERERTREEREGERESDKERKTERKKGKAREKERSSERGKEKPEREGENERQTDRERERGQRKKESQRERDRGRERCLMMLAYVLLPLLPYLPELPVRLVEAYERVPGQAAEGLCASEDGLAACCRAKPKQGAARNKPSATPSTRPLRSVSRWWLGMLEQMGAQQALAWGMAWRSRTLHAV